jgi:NACHT domain
LEITDPSPNHHKAQYQYERGTGDWVLRSSSWEDWLARKIRCLWIHGIPGAGKTVLASHLIQEVDGKCKEDTGRSVVVYYYCYFARNQDEAGALLRWIIGQLCRQSGTVTRELRKLYENGRVPSLVELLTVLDEIIKAFDRVFVFVDAIDESMPREDLLRVLRDLSTDIRFQKIQLLATSRRYIDIENVMSQISVPVSMTNSLVDEDIRVFVRNRVKSNPKLKLWPEELQVEAEAAVTSGAKGM